MVEPPTYGPWHDWYAWRPVRTLWHGWRWLMPVRRRMWLGGGTHGWDYQPATNSLNGDNA